MIRHITVEIRRNETIQLVNSFPEWEIPILKAVHGEDSVVVKGEKLVDRQPPEAADEFVRLNDRYKRSRNEDGSLGTPFVHMVYGEMGVGRLAEAISAAVTDPPEGDLVGEVEKPAPRAPIGRRTAKAAQQKVSSVGG
jgi:hypothetical protein